MGNDEKVVLEMRRVFGKKSREENGRKQTMEEMIITKHVEVWEQ